MRKNIYDAPEVHVSATIDIIQDTIETSKEVEKSIKELVQVLVMVVGVLVVDLGIFVGSIFIFSIFLFKTFRFEVLVKPRGVWLKLVVSGPCKTYFFVFLLYSRFQVLVKLGWLLMLFFFFFQRVLGPFKTHFYLNLKLMLANQELNHKDVETVNLKSQKDILKNELKKEKEYMERFNKPKEAIKYFEELMKSSSSIDGLGVMPKFYYKAKTQ